LVDYSKVDHSGESDNELANMMMETINNMLIEMYATLAHAEMKKREKRQTEGIRAMKERGEWEKYGRPKAIDYNLFEKEYAKVMTKDLRPFECMKRLGLTKPTFYRYKKRYEGNLKN